MATEVLRSVDATINYYPQDGPKVFYPGTAGYQRRNFVSKNIPISDIRGAEDKFDLERNGFQVVKSRWTEFGRDDTNEHVRSVVYPETVEFLKKLTGASDVVIFSHQSRWHTADEVKSMANGLQDSDVLKAVGPTRFAHCDYSVDGASTILCDKLTKLDAEKRRKSRWAIMNVWRPIGRSVTRDALAVLDSQTLDDADLVGVRATFPRPGQGAFDKAYDAGDGYETAQVCANDQHRWYYASQMTPDEALVFKQYDSKTDGRARQTAHSAFQSEDDFGPTRQSIEVRCLVFWEDDDAE